jgi:hypothetical protein
MTDEVSLRFKRSTLWPPIVIALVYPIALLAFMSALGIRGIGWLFDLDTSMGFWFAVFPAVIMIFLVVLPTAMLLFTAVSMSKHRLVFGATDLEWRGIPYPGFRRGRIAYEDIESITGAGRSVLCIFPRHGKAWIIATKAYEGGPGIILQELRARVDSSRFEPELERSLAAPARMDRWSTVLMVAAFAFILGGGGVVFYDIAGRANVAWTRALWLPLSTYIEDFDVGPDGSLWLLTREGVENWRELSNYHVRHITGSAEDSWILPTTRELFGEDGFLLDISEPLHVDRANRPWIRFASPPRYLYWTGDHWEWFVIRLASTEMEATGTVWAGARLWALIPEEPSLLEIDPVTGSSVNHPLGPGAREHITVRPSPDGSILLLTYHDYAANPLEMGLGRFFQGEWSGWHSVDLGEDGSYKLLFPNESMAYARGQFYVRLWHEPVCDDHAAPILVVRFDPGEGTWEWRELRYTQDCELIDPLGAFLVDSRGRIWIEARDGVVVSTGSPFSMPQGEEPQTIAYTESNSGYSYGELRLGPDGRVWNLGWGRETVVWIDANAAELPEPLPYWVGRVIGFPGSGSILMMVGLGLNLWAAYRARRALGRRKRTPDQSGDRSV